jgi:RNA polymerase sigma factor (TIGR02999 family)
MAAKQDEELETHEVTQVLHELRDRPELFNDRLFPLLYTAMKRIARRQMRGERPNATLQPTALVNEAYIRLVRSKTDWQNRGHFLACASNVMRQIMIDYARKHIAKRRGPGVEHVVLDEVPEAKGFSIENVLMVDAALQRLRAKDSLKAQIVHLKYYGGLTMEEIALFVKIGLTSTKEHYRLAVAMLKRDLGA